MQFTEGFELSRGMPFSILGKYLALTTTEFPTYVLSTSMAVSLHQFVTPVFLDSVLIINCSM